MGGGGEVIVSMGAEKYYYATIMLKMSNEIQIPKTVSLA